MRISHEVNEYAIRHGLEIHEAISMGMTEKASEFRRTGSTVYITPPG
jgi:phosphomethylpyrimidine synthase